MKKIILIAIMFLSTFVYGEYLDVTIENKSNYHFDDYLFKDINKTNTEKLEKTLSFQELKVSGNFNNIIGFNYSKNNISSPDKLDSKEIYFGSSKTKFLGYEQSDKKITYGARVNTAKTTKYTIYDILSIEQNKIASTGTEIFPDATGVTDVNGSGKVNRTTNYEKISLSSENLYNHIKENAINGDNYFYGVAISQNFTSWLRMYGVVIASYEQHDYSNGKATTEVNATALSIFGTTAERQKLLATDGRFQGYGYGYNVTAEAYWKDLSLFVTSYYKKTNLKNYHTGIKDAVIVADTKPVDNVISDDRLTFLQKYTSFGLRYRF